jgi:cupin 2 domain-containing protein
MQENNSIKYGNIFNINDDCKKSSEIFEVLIENKYFKIERILSFGQGTPENEWLSESTDEWVVLLQGESEILFENNIQCSLKGGDYVFIPSETKHKVTFTTENPPCIWLAVHGKLK